jgi:hypothetical protein
MGKGEICLQNVDIKQFDDRTRHPPGTVRATRRVAPTIGRLALCSTPSHRIVPAGPWPHDRARPPPGTVRATRRVAPTIGRPALCPTPIPPDRRPPGRGPTIAPDPTRYGTGDPAGRPDDCPPRPLLNAHPIGSSPAGPWPDDRARPPPGTVRATRRVAPIPAQRPSHRIVPRRAVTRRSRLPPTRYGTGDPSGCPYNWPPRPLLNAHPAGSYPAGPWLDDRACPHPVRYGRPVGLPLQLAASPSAQRPSRRIVPRRAVARRSRPPPTRYGTGDPPGRPSNWPPRPLLNAHPAGSYPAGP